MIWTKAKAEKYLELIAAIEKANAKFDAFKDLEKIPDAFHIPDAKLYLAGVNEGIEITQTFNAVKP